MQINTVSELCVGVKNMQALILEKNLLFINVDSYFNSRFDVQWNFTS